MSNELKPCPSVWKNKDITPEPYGETNMIVVLRENELYGEYWQMLGFYEYDTVRKTTVKWCYLDDLLNTRPDDDLRERNRELEKALELEHRKGFDAACFDFKMTAKKHGGEIERIIRKVIESNNMDYDNL